MLVFQVNFASLFSCPGSILWKKVTSMDLDFANIPLKPRHFNEIGGEMIAKNVKSL